MISLIILSKTTTEKAKWFLSNTINSLTLSNNVNLIDEVIIVENSDEKYSFNTPFKLKVLNNTDEFNYNAFMNYGIRHLENPKPFQYIAICNNDLEFHQDWLKTLTYSYDSMSPKCPLTPSQKVFKENTKGYRIAQEISGWCILFKYNLWKKIGGLDESCTFWFSDNIYAEQLKQHNYEHWLITDSIVMHKEGGSNTLKTLPKEEQKKLTTDQKINFNERNK